MSFLYYFEILFSGKNAIKQDSDSEEFGSFILLYMLLIHYGCYLCRDWNLRDTSISFTYIKLWKSRKSQLFFFINKLDAYIHMAHEGPNSCHKISLCKNKNRFPLYLVSMKYLIINLIYSFILHIFCVEWHNNFLFDLF